MRRKARLLCFAVLVFMVLVAGVASAAPSGKWAQGISIWYFVGGAEGDSYGSIKLKGAQQAAADLGCDVNYIFSGWDQAKIAQQMREAVASKPDGIALCWLGSDADLMPVAKQCKASGILLDLANVDYPKVRAEYGGGYVGVFDLKQQGTALGDAALKRLQIKAGDHALVFGAFSQPNRFWREEGTALALEKAGLKVTRQDTPPTWGADPNLATPVVSAALLADPKIKIIVYPGGQLLGATETYMKAANKKPGEIFGIGFDTSAAVMLGFQHGYVQLTSDQQPFLQGYLPILSLCMQKKFNFAPILYETGAGFVDTANWQAVSTLATAGIR
jgi:simple sugar transport system substrate-binding protein